MKKNYLYIVSFVAFAFLMMSCTDDEIIETPTISSPSQTIAFGADIEWADPDQTRSTSPNRVGNFYLLADTGEEVLPCGVYVQDGIQYNSEENALTRGAVINSIGDSFDVWATYNKDNVSSEFFSNLEFSKGSGNVFNSQNTYYWPGSGTLDFVAVANTPAGNYFTHQMSSDGTKLESFTYTVPAAATQQNDIIVATAKGVAGNNNASVPLSFKHIMSAVNVKIGKVVKGEIRSITFKNVYNKGEYLVEQGVWVVDKTSVGDFTVTMAGDKFVSSGTDAEGTPVNTADGTFMFIPQNPGETAEMVIEFYDSSTGRLYSDEAGAYKPALRGSIAGDNWEKGKTTNYMLSIDESFTLTIEPVGKKLDAHYIISQVNVTVDGINNWTIEAEASDGAYVTIQPEEEVNPLAKQGFWTDKVVGSDGEDTSESARGSSSYSGTGSVTNMLFYLFIPENIGNADRQIKITLKGTGNASASTSKVLLQKCPNWTAGGFGWEVVDDDESGKYGFKWTRKVAYIYPYSWTLTDLNGHEDFVKNFIKSYGANSNDFATAVRYIHSGSIVTQKRYYILLDYSKLNNITGADSDIDGFNNTLALYRQAGTTATSQFETILKTTLKTESGKETENMFRLPNSNEVSSGKVPAESGTANDLSAIMEIIQKKNRYYLQKKTQKDSEGNTIVTYVPYFFEEDLKWYLPASGQFTYFTPDPNIAGDNKANYWSSTTAGTTTAWTGGPEEKDRDLEYSVIAVRKDVNGYGNASVQVNNGSLAGGENGNSNTWVE